MKNTKGILVFLSFLIVWGILPVSISAFALQTGLEKFLQKGIHGEGISLDLSLILYEGLEVVYSDKEGVDHFYNPITSISFWLEEEDFFEEEKEEFFLSVGLNMDEDFLETSARKIGIFEKMPPDGAPLFSEWFFWQ
ncbi:hypothetical protein KAI58_02715 [Candidatus Gracilibacteria bacterium]|nr:hypothetical protein [Candidatus Gracilibacteria bacterium]